MLYRGIDKIEHRKPVKYYVQLFTGKVPTVQSALVDDVVDLNAIVVPPCLRFRMLRRASPRISKTWMAKEEIGLIFR